MHDDQGGKVAQGGGGLAGGAPPRGMAMRKSRSLTIDGDAATEAFTTGYRALDRAQVLLR